MTEIVADLTGEIRSARIAERPPGHTAPSTGDAAQQPAVTQPNPQPLPGSQADFPVEGVGGPARRDAANHFGWRLQAGMEIRSYAETMASRDVEAGGTVILDPAMATIWHISAAGDLTLSIPDIPDSTVGGQPAQRVVSLVLYIQRAAGSTITWPPGTLFARDVLDPDGDGDRADSLLGPPPAASLDHFVLIKAPIVGWHGYVAGLDLVAV